jgi:alkylhydroperoxidase family enzyme
MTRVTVPEGMVPLVALMSMGTPEVAAHNHSTAWNRAYDHTSLSPREREVVRHRIAHLQGCEFCATIRTESELSHASDNGIPDPFYDNIFNSSWGGYTPRERLLLELLEGFIDDHEQLRNDDRLWDELRAQFTETEIIDVCYHMIGPMYGRGLMAKVLLDFTTLCDVLPAAQVSTESNVSSPANGSPTGTSRAMK